MTAGNGNEPPDAADCDAAAAWGLLLTAVLLAEGVPALLTPPDVAGLPDVLAAPDPAGRGAPDPAGFDVPDAACGAVVAWLAPAGACCCGAAELLGAATVSLLILSAARAIAPPSLRPYTLACHLSEGRSVVTITKTKATAIAM